jgi:hypothetical protein
MGRRRIKCTSNRQSWDEMRSISVPHNVIREIMKGDRVMLLVAPEDWK